MMNLIVALRNEKGSYNELFIIILSGYIVALRNEKGSYNVEAGKEFNPNIVALRNEKDATSSCNSNLL